MHLILAQSPMPDKVLPFTPPMPSNVAAEQRKLHEARRQMIADTRKDQARSGYQQREALHDSDTALKCAQIVLDQEAAFTGNPLRPDFRDLPSRERHELFRDLSVGIRYRRTVYRRVARHAFQQKAVETLRTFLSHKLSAGEIAMLARELTGAPLTTFVGVLDGAIPTGPTEYAAATLDMLAELVK